MERNSQVVYDDVPAAQPAYEETGVRIECDGLVHRFGRRLVLDDVRWRIGPGLTGLLGPNGAGKTTILSVLATLTRPQQGRVSVGGHDLADRRGRAEVRRVLGFVPQRFSLAPEMRLTETVAYAGWINGMADAECYPAAATALATVGLVEKGKNRVRSLSGGERQRLGVAAAIAHNPKVLLLDEPTVGLDPGQRLRLREYLAEIGTTRTVVIASHLLEDIAMLCGRVGVLLGGRLVFDGSVDELTGQLDAGTASCTRLGSDIERAYDSLLTRLGEQR